MDESIQLVHGAAAERFFSQLGWTNCQSLVCPADVDAFKHAGGFNSDWELAFAWMLLYLFKSRRYDSTDGEALRAKNPTVERFIAEVAVRGGWLDSAVSVIREMCRDDEWPAIQAQWDRPGLQRMFQETYSGDLCEEVYGFEPRIVNGQGLIYKDKPILDKGFVSQSIKLGIATGRTAGETEVALRLMGWTDLFPKHAVITEDDGFKKPDPAILALAVERLGSRSPMYVGDTPDDLLTVRKYRETHGPMLSCMVLTGLKGSDKKDRFAEGQTDIIADNVNAALMAVTRCMGGALCPAEKQR